MTEDLGDLLDSEEKLVSESSWTTVFQFLFDLPCSTSSCSGKEG
jgi:hypothetical protein